MANFFIRTTADKGKATLYVRVRRLQLNWTLSTGISVDVTAWRKNYESGNAKLWDRYTAEGSAGAELKKKMDKIDDTINLLFKEKRIKSAADKNVLVNALFELANADGIKAREEMKQMERETEEKRLRTIWAYYDYFLIGISNGTITKGVPTMVDHVLQVGTRQCCISVISLHESCQTEQKQRTPRYGEAKRVSFECGCERI